MAQLKSTSITGDLSVTGGLLASKIIKRGGTDTQVLLANGSVKGFATANTANTLVARDANGNFSAGTITFTGIRGEKIILDNTSTAGNGLIMYRNAGGANEALRINVDANNGTITNTNETLQSLLNLVLEYKDTANSGTGAGSKTIVFKATSEGSAITANSFIGNASTASTWQTSRTFYISGTAGTTGTAVNGSQNVTLVIPQTISNFTSITSSTINADVIYANSNTAADSRGLIVTRYGNDEKESVRIGVNDSEAQFIYTNDETASSFKFQLVNTDTETGSGAKANTATVTFSGASGKSTVTANTFSGALNGNATSANKVNNKLSINGKTFDGSAAVDIGVIGTAYGGTGSSSFTANRIVWTESATKMTAGYHYVDQTHIGVGVTTTKPTYTLQVGTDNNSAGTLGVANTITIADEVTMQYDSDLKAMKFVF